MKVEIFPRVELLSSVRVFALTAAALCALLVLFALPVSDARAFDCGVGQVVQVDKKRVAQTGKCIVPDGLPEVCELFRGMTVTVSPEGEVCKGLDQSGTFCILGGELQSSEVFPCQGLLNRARKCNLDYGRPLLNPFACDARCDDDEIALGAECVRKCAKGGLGLVESDCVPERRVDLAHLREHCPRTPVENGISRAVKGAGTGPHLGEWCEISRRGEQVRACYALAAPFAGLSREDLENDNGQLLSEVGLYSCDEVLQFCPEGTRDIDGSYFTEGDCLGEAVYRVDLGVLEKRCPVQGAEKGWPRQPEENGVYPTDIFLKLQGVLAGKWCELSVGPPYRYCYATKEAFHGYRKDRLETANEDNLSVVDPPLNLCDEVLRFCPEGEMDGDGDPFTEGDCVPVVLGGG